MTYTEIQNLFYIKIGLLSKELTNKILLEAELDPKYAKNTLWTEITVMEKDQVKFIGSNFTFFIYFKDSVPGTHVISFVPRLELNSNSYDLYTDKYIEKMHTDLLIANKIIKSILTNKEYISEKVCELFNESIL